MKLSNNALNFLLAQYRAIFKRAYVKGIASAVILTAGLAATQANADTLSGGAASWDEITTSNSFTIANGASGSTPARGEEYFLNGTVACTHNLRILGLVAAPKTAFCHQLRLS